VVDTPDLRLMTITSRMLSHVSSRASSVGVGVIHVDTYLASLITIAAIIFSLAFLRPRHVGVVAIKDRSCLSPE